MANNSNISVQSTTVNNLVPTVRDLTRKCNDLQTKYEALLNVVNAGEGNTMTQLATRVNQLTSLVNSLSERVNNINLSNYVRNIEFNSLNSSLNDLKDTVADVRTNAGKANDVDTLNTYLNTLAIKLNNVETSVSQLTGNVAAVNNTISDTVNSRLETLPSAADLRLAVTNSTRNRNSIATINSQLRTMQSDVASANNLIARLSYADEAIVSSLEQKVSNAEYLGLVNAVNTKASQANFIELVNNVHDLVDKVDDQLPQTMENYSELLYNDIRRRQQKIITILDYLYNCVKKQLEDNIENIKAQAAIDTRNALIQHILNGDINPSTGETYDVSDLNDLINEILATVDNDFIGIVDGLERVEQAFNYLDKDYIRTSGDNTSYYSVIGFNMPSEILGKPAEEYLPSYVAGNVDENLRSYLIDWDSEINNRIIDAKKLSYAYIMKFDPKITEIKAYINSHESLISDIKAAKNQLELKVANDSLTTATALRDVTTRTNEASAKAENAVQTTSALSSSINDLGDRVERNVTELNTRINTNKTFTDNFAKSVFGASENIKTYINNIDDTNMSYASYLTQALVDNNVVGLTSIVYVMANNSSLKSQFHTNSAVVLSAVNERMDLVRANAIDASTENQGTPVDLTHEP